MVFNLEQIITTGGLLGIFLIVFAESGLFLGFFLPGDSLLITAGLLASQKIVNLAYLIPVAISGAILGDTVGFWFGRKTGPKIFNKEDSLIFHKKNLLKANEFYQKHGGKTIVLARFMPFIRTFAPIVAGVGEMDYRRFLSFNIFGGIFWVLVTTLAGYFLGRSIPEMDRYIGLAAILTFFIPGIPGLIHFWQEYRQSLWVRVKKQLGRFKS
jgi:membrane-associated protein